MYKKETYNNYITNKLLFVSKYYLFSSLLLQSLFRISLLFHLHHFVDVGVTAQIVPLQVRLLPHLHNHPQSRPELHKSN